MKKIVEQWKAFVQRQTPEVLDRKVNTFMALILTACLLASVIATVAALYRNEEPGFILSGVAVSLSIMAIIKLL
jgi:magnesium-transporting ATPase (P-type)